MKSTRMKTTRTPTVSPSRLPAFVVLLNVFLAEDWYTNDYPEEEESDRENEEDLSGEYASLVVHHQTDWCPSDEFHEHSDYDDAVHERSTTAYRDVMSDDF